MENTKALRYLFEHQVLVYFFYNTEINFMMSLSKYPDLINQFWISMLEEKNEDNPIEDTWKSTSFQVGDSYYCIRVDCPKPLNDTECYWIYLLCDINYEHPYYYTVEKGGSIDGQGFIGCWNKDFVHMNFGLVDLDEEEIYKRIIIDYDRMVRDVKE